jgi:hypothetical protein
MPWLLTAAAAVSASSTLVPATKRDDIRPPSVESSAKCRSDEFRESAIRTERNMGMETAWDGENPFVVFLILMCREYKKQVSGLRCLGK